MATTKPGRLSERLGLTRREPPRSRLEDLVVITGYSGAGKSTAMQVFEDAGYFCVDNLPPEMIAGLVELFMHEGSKVERAAVVSDVRGGAYFVALQKVKEHADATIDSTGLKASTLRRKIADEFLPREPLTRLAVTFQSFGFKHGPPRDADLTFDVRFLPNPHWEPDLRPLTGHDRRIAEYVGGQGTLKDFYDRLIPLLDFLVPQYLAEGKAHLMVAIGCTGGRHRSVVIAEDLAARYRDDDKVFVEVVHRDIDRQSAGA